MSVWRKWLINKWTERERKKEGNKRWKEAQRVEIKIENENWKKKKWNTVKKKPIDGYKNN